MWRNRLNFCKKPCNLNQYKFLIEAFAYCRVQSLRTIIKNLYTKVMLASWYHLYLALFRRLLLFNPFHPKTSSQGTLVFYTSEVALRDVLSCITRRKCLSFIGTRFAGTWRSVFFFFRAILVLELTCFFFFLESYFLWWFQVLRLFGVRKSQHLHGTPRLCTAMKAMCIGSWEDIKYGGRDPSASHSHWLSSGSQRWVGSDRPVSHAACTNQVPLLNHPFKTALG
jgi:hypothetical protein